MTPAQALAEAYRTGDLTTIANAEIAYQDDALRAYGDVGSLLHSEPPGYEQAFLRVMGEMQAIEDAAKGET